MAPHLRRPWMTMLHDVMLASTETLAEDAPTNLTGANMAFHRRVLAKVPAFDVELGPGRLGFQDDVLFSKQLERAGYRIQRRFDVRVEHHFDFDRLLRKSFLGPGWSAKASPRLTSRITGSIGTWDLPGNTTQRPRFCPCIA